MPEAVRLRNHGTLGQRDALICRGCETGLLAWCQQCATWVGLTRYALQGYNLGRSQGTAQSWL